MSHHSTLKTLISQIKEIQRKKPWYVITNICADTKKQAQAYYLPTSTLGRWFTNSLLSSHVALSNKQENLLVLPFILYDRGGTVIRSFNVTAVCTKPQKCISKSLSSLHTRHCTVMEGERISSSPFSSVRDTSLTLPLKAASYGLQLDTWHPPGKRSIAYPPQHSLLPLTLRETTNFTCTVSINL